MSKPNFKSIALIILIILPYAGMAGLWKYFASEKSKISHASFVVISKQDMMLRQYDYKGQVIAEYPVAVGRNYGNKTMVGDMKTPEGVFLIEDIQNASDWKHDFGDGKGEIEGAYGNFFVRLTVPGQKGIGIHGTHDPASIGTRATEGCIRLNNENLDEFVKHIHPSMVVLIQPSTQDVIADADTLNNHVSD